MVVVVGGGSFLFVKAVVEFLGFEMGLGGGIEVVGMDWRWE